MLETIKQIRELATATENTYLLHKISILEIEIQTEISNQKIELLKKYI
tara:strand:- start:1421 stop:1564 length:144 start_codon:yes stop_codon:yes gene_type:complete